MCQLCFSLPVGQHADDPPLGDNRTPQEGDAGRTAWGVRKQLGTRNEGEYEMKLEGKGLVGESKWGKG